MKFLLIDRITELVPGKSIKAKKALSLAEEYLADHFPRFPVLPGVLMIEALTQASACLVRRTEDFAHSMIVLAEAKNVIYKSFVSPGNIFEMTVEAKEIGPQHSSFIGTGFCGETEMVKARWSLRHFNLADEDPAMAPMDQKIISNARERMELLLRS